MEGEERREEQGTAHGTSVCGLMECPELDRSDACTTKHHSEILFQKTCKGHNVKSVVPLVVAGLRPQLGSDFQSSVFTLCGPSVAIAFRIVVQSSRISRSCSI